MPAFYRRRIRDSNRARSLERDAPIDMRCEGWIVRDENDRRGLIFGTESAQNDFTDRRRHAVQRAVHNQHMGSGDDSPREQQTEDLAESKLMSMPCHLRRKTVRHPIDLFIELHELKRPLNVLVSD